MAGSGFYEPVRANDATVIHLYQANCHKPGCTWAGALRYTFADANADRSKHLDTHRTLIDNPAVTDA
jgi:hypothetical protein